jgi:dTDP-4-dehydrorhamnose 3,5-epimerase
MNFVRKEIPDVVRLEPRIFEDSRGFFMETFREEQLAAEGINAHFVQENHSGSHQGVLRGLHYQIHQTQAKLVRVIAGEIFDVAVDLRRSSPTFGRWTGEKLSAENRILLWLPKGFAHGFYVLSEWAEVIYKTTDYFAPDWSRSLLWSDPAIGIQWPLVKGLAPLVSDKDARGKLLSGAEVFD